jgi:hypothetical protein
MQEDAEWTICLGRTTLTGHDPEHPTFALASNPRSAMILQASIHGLSYKDGRSTRKFQSSTQLGSAKVGSSLALFVYWLLWLA